MQISTTRFGTVEIRAADIIHFPFGLLGFGGAMDWVLLADAENDSLGWLQSVTQSELALAVVSPRQFVPEYQVRIARSELTALELDDVAQAHVLVTVSAGDNGLTLNLKAPLVIHLERRLGRQVIATGEQPLQYALPGEPVQRRKAA